MANKYHCIWNHMFCEIIWDFWYFLYVGHTDLVQSSIVNKCCNCLSFRSKIQLCIRLQTIRDQSKLWQLHYKRKEIPEENCIPFFIKFYFKLKIISSITLPERNLHFLFSFICLNEYSNDMKCDLVFIINVSSGDIGRLYFCVKKKEISKQFCVFWGRCLADSPSGISRPQ